MKKDARNQEALDIINRLAKRVKGASAIATSLSEPAPERFIVQPPPPGESTAPPGTQNDDLIKKVRDILGK